MSEKTNAELRAAKYKLLRRLKRLDIEDITRDEQLEDLRIRLNEPGVAFNPGSVLNAELKCSIAAAELAKAEIGVRRAKTQHEIDRIDRDLRNRKSLSFGGSLLGVVGLLASSGLGSYLDDNRRELFDDMPRRYEIPPDCGIRNPSSWDIHGPIKENPDPLAGSSLKPHVYADITHPCMDRGFGGDCADGRQG